MNAPWWVWPLGFQEMDKITQWSKTGFKTDILINSSCRGPLHKCIIADWGRCFRAKAVQTCSLWVSRIFKDFFIPSFDRPKTLDPRDGIKFFEWENAKDWLWYYNRCVYRYEAAVLTTGGVCTHARILCSFFWTFCLLCSSSTTKWTVTCLETGPVQVQVHEHHTGGGCSEGQHLSHQVGWLSGQRFKTLEFPGVHLCIGFPRSPLQVWACFFMQSAIKFLHAADFVLAAPKS